VRLKYLHPLYWLTWLIQRSEHVGQTLDYDDDDDDDYPGGWFGESWGAPICDEETRQPTPVGWACASPGCDRLIGADDQGLLIPYVYELGSMSLTAEHIACFRRGLGSREELSHDSDG